MPQTRTARNASMSEPNQGRMELAVCAPSGSSPDTPAGRKAGRRRALVVSARLWVDGVEVMPDTFSFHAVSLHAAVLDALADLHERRR